MKKLLLLLIITGQTTFGIDKKLVGSLALGAFGTVATIWSGLSVFDRRGKIKELQNDTMSLSTNPENAKNIQEKIYTNAQKLELVSESIWPREKFFKHLEKEPDRKKFLSHLTRMTPSYIMPGCIGILSSLLFAYSCYRYKSLKN